MGRAFFLRRQVGGLCLNGIGRTKQERRRRGFGRQRAVLLADASRLAGIGTSGDENKVQSNHVTAGIGGTTS